MSSVLYPPARPQTIGEVLDTAFRIFRVTLLKVLPFSVLATISGQLQNVYVILSGRAVRRFATADPAWWGLYLLGLYLSFTFIGAITLRQAALASGNPSAGTTALAEGARMTPMAIGMALLICVVVGLCFVPLLGVPREYLYVAFCVLLIPGAYIVVLFVCSFVALLVGRKGIIGSMRYSAHLVRGNWWRTVMIYTVVLTMIIVLSVTAGLIIGVFTQLFAARDLAVMTAVSAVMVVASGAIYMPFVTAMTLSLYGDLEARKEGTDLERRIAGEPVA